MFYNIGGQPITYRSNAACHINSVKRLFPDAFLSRNVSNITKKSAVSCANYSYVCPFFLKSPLSHHKAQTYNSCIIKISFEVIRNKTCGTILRCHLRFDDFILAERPGSVSWTIKYQIQISMSLKYAA